MGTRDGRERGVLLHYFRRRRRRRHRLLTNKVADPEGRKGGSRVREGARRKTPARPPAQFLSGFLTNPLFPSIHHFHATDETTERGRRTIFSPRSPSRSLFEGATPSPAEEGEHGEGGRGTTDGSEWNPFCPPSWKQLENGCRMRGDRERERVSEPASERTGKKKF